MNMTEAEREEYSRMYDQTHYISSVDKIPTTAHFVVLLNESRSYPSSYGEKYGNDTCAYMQYIAFDNEEALKYWITREMKESYSHKTFKVFHVKPVSVVTHQSLEIKS